MALNEDVKKIKIEEYNYSLPEEFIAKYPLENREDSKLLIADESKFHISQYKFLDEHLPENSLLLFNETKVVQARLLFPKNENTIIEVFCLEPADNMDIQQAMAAEGQLDYICLVGGARKWKAYLLELKTANDEILKAEKIENLGGTFRIRFTWDSELCFSEILEEVGKIPLPPYLNRKTEKDDLNRYQTVFAKNDGSVAAPTASLHFTDSLMERLRNRNCQIEKLTLHVGAGTFKPVEAEEISDHKMHAEEFWLSLDLVKSLAKNHHKNIISVGTTSMRALESIYWLGVLASQEKLEFGSVPFVDQWIAYESKEEIDLKISLDALIYFMEENKLQNLLARTAIIIAPSYKFKLANGLITNFHQPKSTLLLLVAALIGSKWESMYQFAKENDFRFLSYGDGCLLLNSQNV